MARIARNRRINLAALVREAEGQIRRTELTDTPAPYISQILNAAPNGPGGLPRTMGNKVARRIERAMGEPEDWMDENHERTREGLSNISPAPNYDRAIIVVTLAAAATRGGLFFV